MIALFVGRGREGDKLRLPANILRSCVPHVRPERVRTRLVRIELPKGIGKPSTQKFRKSFTLLRRETGRLFVAFRVCEIWIVTKISNVRN